MSDVIKNAVYRQRRTFNKSFSKGKTWHCRSIAERISEQKLASLLIKSLLEKLINSVLFGSGRRATWSRNHCSVQWRWAIAVSQHALRAALHIVNIDSELNLTSISNFCINFYYCCIDNSTICTNRLLVLWNFCPFLVLMCNGSERVLFCKVK